MQREGFTESLKMYLDEAGVGGEKNLGMVRENN